MIGNKEPYIPEGNSPILANSGFVHTDDITYNPDTKTVTCSKSTSGWNAQIYSKSGYKDNVFVTYKPSQTNANIIIGLDSNPSENASWSSIDYGFYNHNDGSMEIVEGGSFIALPASHNTYAIGDELRIEYSASFVKYYHNGALIRSVYRNIGDALYLDSSFHTSGSVYDVEFGVGLGNTNKPTVVYEVGQLSNSQTLVDSFKEFARAHSAEPTISFEGIGYISGGTQSDLPAVSTIWTYATVKFIVRFAEALGREDGTIILYGYDSNKIAMKAIANGTARSGWLILE